MKAPRNFPLLGGLAVLLAVLLVALTLWHREQQLRRDETAVAAEYESNRKLTRLWQARHSADAAASTASSEVPAKAGSATRASRDTNRDVLRRLREMPEYAAHRQRELRRRTMREYGPWFSQLKLPPERLGTLKALIDDRIATGQDAFEMAIAAGYKMGTAEFEKITRRYDQESEQRLREFLGADEYAGFVRFLKARGWINAQLEEFESYLAERALPALTAEQKTTLIEAHDAAGGWKAGPGKPSVGVQYRAINERTATLAAGLERAQHEAFLAYLKFDSTRSQLLGQLLRPDSPDGAIFYPTLGRR